MKQHLLSIIFSLVLFIHNGYSQCAKYEPPDGKVMLIVGQDCNATGGTAYGSGYVDDASLSVYPPSGITTYYSLTVSAGAGLNSLMNWGAGPLHAQQYIGNSIYTNSVICIGLFMTDGNGNTLNVNGGSYDAHLDALANWIKSISPRPVYLRIGYEFDGQYWNNPTAYKNAWTYIVDRFRAQDVNNCAYVWQAATGTGGTAYLLQWYPGDSYVDWLGYSHFEFSGNQNEGADIFTLARLKRKPVMIAEATPRGYSLNNSTDASTAWNGYFTRMFTKINNNIDVVKALCYINQDWEAQPLWTGGGWGNSRLQGTTIEANWISEISKSYWLHASSTLFSELQNSNTQQPYGGTAAGIPGTIQAENFDSGCIGVSYYDNTGGNTGGSVYRYGYSVDIGPTGDGSGTYDVAWISAGEWLEYTVNTGSSAPYNFTFRVSSPNSGNTFHLEQDGVNVSGTISVPNTGSWTSYTNLAVNNITLSNGTHVLKLVFDNVPGFNLNYFSTQSTLLPVTYVSFSAYLENNSVVRIEWIISLEADNNLFEIERSQEFMSFEKIGESRSRNVKVDFNNYAFVDSSIKTGTNYYRVKQIDINGNYSYSKVVEVKIGSREISIYPNPCTDRVFIQSSKIVKVQVFTLVGALLVEAEVDKNAIDVSSLENGNYFLKLIDGNGNNYFSRLLKINP